MISIVDALIKFYCSLIIMNTVLKQSADCYSTMQVGQFINYYLVGMRRCNDFIDHMIFVSLDARADAQASAQVYVATEQGQIQDF